MGEPLGCYWHTPQSLFEEVRKDELYYLATGGGVTFGGGEPLLNADFICRFRGLCGGLWRLCIETSLNAETHLVERLLPVIDCWYIDIKDMNADIYHRYTGENNEQVVSNLRLIVSKGCADKCVIRLPLIPNYNTEADILRSEQRLRAMGFNSFDKLRYIIP